MNLEPLLGRFEVNRATSNPHKHDFCLVSCLDADFSKRGLGTRLDFSPDVYSL